MEFEKTRVYSFAVSRDICYNTGNIWYFLFMQMRIIVLISFLVLSLFPTSAWAEDGYIGEDL